VPPEADAGVQEGASGVKVPSGLMRNRGSVPGGVALSAGCVVIRAPESYREVIASRVRPEAKMVCPPVKGATTP
jgi:hypothetical protein